MSSIWTALAALLFFWVVLIRPIVRLSRRVGADMRAPDEAQAAYDRLVRALYWRIIREHDMIAHANGRPEYTISAQDQYGPRDTAWQLAHDRAQDRFNAQADQADWNRAHSKAITRANNTAAISGIISAVRK